jgi:hypothetical protein
MLKLFSAAIAICAFVACSSTKEFNTYKKQFAGDTISTLENIIADSGFFKSNNGKVYPVFPSVDSSLMEEPAPLAAARIMAAPPPPEALAQVDLIFAPNSENPVREEAKTTKPPGARKTFSSIVTLYNSLPADDLMDTFNIGNKTPRVKPEQKNITLKKVYIYLITREEDNDYHMIIGDKPNYQDATVRFNAEISGLPKNFPALEETLRKVRMKIAENIGKIPKKASNNNGTSIPVKISGSLFYDAHHRGSFGGQGNIKSTTVWEIHPVTSIIFL